MNEVAAKPKKKYKIKPTIRQKRVLDNLAENGGNLGKAILDAGYSKVTSLTPSKVTDTRGWKELLKEELPDSLIAQRHKELLNSQYVDHMVFPLNITDEQITETLAEVNCVARRFMHSETQTHVWFWSPDNKARKDAVDMAYKLKGNYAPEKSVSVNIEVEADNAVKELTKQLNDLYGGTGIKGDGGVARSLDTQAQD